jgi:hypothetical protein
MRNTEQVYFLSANVVPNTIAGVLFPKVRNEDGSAKPQGGWERWDGGGGEQPPTAAAPSTRRQPSVQTQR